MVGLVIKESQKISCLCNTTIIQEIKKSTKKCDFVSVPFF